METLDWTKLAKDITPETGRVPYEPNKHLFRKVAFDVFQLNNAPVKSLWILEEDEDGTQFLAAQYNEEQSEESLEAKSHWLALADREGKNVTLVYKDVPIQRFASSEYGFSPEDVHIFQDALTQKLAKEEEFVVRLLEELPTEKAEVLAQQFPELKKKS